MSKFFTYKGAQLAFEVKGKGRAIVLLHGFLGSKSIWKNYTPRLCKKFRVITVDLLGHGESDCLGYVHHMEQSAAAIKALLTHLRVRKAILVGHSLGGYVSLAFAEKYPEAVLGLLLINSTAKGDTQKQKSSRNQLIELVKKDKARAVELLVPNLFTLKNRKTTYWKKSYSALAKKCSERGIIATVEGMKIRKEREIILKFAPFPYQLVVGKEDAILEPASLIEQSQLSKNGSFVLFENSSHMAVLEETEKTLKTIINFSKRQPSLSVYNFTVFL